MRRMTSRRTWIALVTSAMLVLGCAGGPPAPDQQLGDVTRLEAVVPLVSELHVIGFENSAHCRSLEYERGTFSAVVEGGCDGAGTQPFDAVAMADHTRLAEAILAANAGVIRIQNTTYDAQDELESVWLKLQDATIEDDWQYLYDPTGAVPKVDQPDRITFRRIDDDWWFVWSFDD
jgi:hypothetical protein